MLNSKKKETVHKATIPSAKSLFYYNWAMEFPKENIQILNESLNRFLTFSVALFSIVTILKADINPNFIPFIMSFLVLCVFISFIGNFPTEQKYNPNRPDITEEVIKIITTKKKIYLLLSFSFIFISMCLILIGIICK